MSIVRVFAGCTKQCLQGASYKTRAGLRLAGSLRPNFISCGKYKLPVEPAAVLIALFLDAHGSSCTGSPHEQVHARGALQHATLSMRARCAGRRARSTTGRESPALACEVLTSDVERAG